MAVLCLAAWSFAGPGPSATAVRPAGTGLGLKPSALGDRQAVTAWLAAHQTRSPRLLDRSLVRDGGSWAVTGGGSSTVSGSSVRPTALAVTMPDVTHDGVDDVFQVNVVQRRYLVRDGVTGRLLWRRDATDVFDAEYARLGAPARPALLVQSVTTVDGVARFGVLAIDAATGRDLWSANPPSAAVGALVAGADVQDEFLAGAAPGRSGADQVVVGRLTGTLGPAGAQASVAPAVLDGASGAQLRQGLPIAADDVPAVSALGDVTGDGVGDIAVTANGTERQAALYDGASGNRSWLHVTPDGNGLGSYADPLVGADRSQAAVLVSDRGFDASSASTSFSAAGGGQRWTVSGVTGTEVADSDGDRVPDLVGVSFDGDGFVVVGVSGRTGRVRYRTAVSLPQTVDGSSSATGGSGGDLSGDGVDDQLFQVDATGSHPVHESVVVDGRSGARRAYRALAGWPLGARLADRGDALVDTVAADTTVTLTARTLRRTLWTERLSAHRVVGPAFLDYGRLTRRTRTEDVLLSLFGYDGSDIVALRGDTGRPLWRVHVG